MYGTRHAQPLWKALRDARASADDILARFGIAVPPVNVERVARAMDIIVNVVPRLPYSGSVQVLDGLATIEVCADESHARRNFTVAHELGHLMLHPMSELTRAFRDKSFVGTRREMDANEFAADLLMPLPMLRRYVNAFGMSADRLAPMFQVSPAAMRVRLARMMGAPRWGIAR